MTNYECYKGLYSAFNSMNLFEIAHSLGRQFGPEPWTLYRGKHLMNFADNHDVTRIASILNDEKANLPAVRRAVRHAGHSVPVLRQRVGAKAKSMRVTTPCARASMHPSKTS